MWSGPLGSPLVKHGASSCLRVAGMRVNNITIPSHWIGAGTSHNEVGRWVGMESADGPEAVAVMGLLLRHARCRLTSVALVSAGSAGNRCGHPRYAL